LGFGVWGLEFEYNGGRREWDREDEQEKMCEERQEEEEEEFFKAEY
jgi:hypothetical protein